MEKGSNSILKTMVFIIIVALSFLLFFGLGEGDKTDIQLVSFGFIIFAEVVVFVSTLLPKLLKETNLTGADVISAGIIYAIASVLINMVFTFDSLRYLIVCNCAAILAYMLIVVLVILNKKRH